LLGVSRSGYYTWAQHHISARRARDEEIAAVIGRLRSEKGAFFHTYGSPRMHAELRMGHGFRIGRKRVERIMRERGWAGAVKRKFRFRANPATSEDRVNRNFHVPGPNRLWLGDITEHHTAEGKVYCAVVLDAYSRLAIGWSIGSRMTADLVVDALQMARWRRFGVRGAIMHSDHGSQGGFNRSSQHLVMEVSDGSSSAGSRQGNTTEAAVAWSSEVPSCGRDSVLVSDCEGFASRGGRERGRRGAGGRGSVVPQRWRYAAI
jgi:hypothetical protein